jgi:hypothetical protein
MTVTMLPLSPAASDAHVAHARGLRERAGSLRAQAAHLEPVLATSYRRRASELELEAFLLRLLAGGGGEGAGGDITGAPAA